ncbi:MAG: glycosyltransferase family 2 protein [Clostridia bacterium]|nr:glycosyltransferase family 2 protein [Clostridia bacterium]
MEKIDILLATYNGETYLKEQLDSILNQTYSNFRILISDDNSEDSTKNIIEEYAKKDNRIKFFFQERNLGVIANFEFLLKKVEAEFYMFSDQDDIWKENKIELSMKKILEENCDLVYTNLEVVDKDLNITYDSYWKLKGLEEKVKKYNNFESLYLNNFITGCTMLSKSEFISEILPLPKESKYVLHDYWTALIVSQRGKISYIEEPLIKYRQHKKNSVGSKKKTDSINSLNEIRKLFIDVKKEHFEVFITNENKFIDEKYRILNRKALEYYKTLEQTKNINFKNWKLFFKLYKYEKFMYKMENFIILNIPFVAKVLFGIKTLVKK